ncbi:MAG TPA: glycosyltransferase [Actinospica sp.]|jgi:hypothetical protein|nr:glycosyltransferase [Actinospica sp.]
MLRWIRLLLTAFVVVALTYTVFRVIHPGPGSGWVRQGYVIASWTLFAAAAWLVRKTPLRAAVPLIVLGGLLIQIAAVTGPPITSDDLYRYVWDGRVQAAGIDPYSYVPAAPQLDFLRDPSLWPDHVTQWCVHAGTNLTPGCTLINRPAVHTIYPPVAQAYFYLVHVLWPSGGYRSIQYAAVVVSLLTVLALIYFLRRSRLDPRSAALWAWCPAVATEAANNGHIDVLSALLAVCALGVLAHARTTRSVVKGGVLLGMAAATKFIPVLAVPGTLRRKPTVLIAAVSATFVGVYIPHVIAVGGKVIGYLPGYLQEEGYDSGNRSVLIDLFVPDRYSTAVAALVIAVTAFIAYRTSDPGRPWRAATVVTGTALLATTPEFQWYSLLLVALVALDGRFEWLAVAAAINVSNVWHDVTGAPLPNIRAGYGVALVVVLAATAVRLISRRLRRSPADAPTAVSERIPMDASSFVDVVLPCLDESAALPYIMSRLPEGYRAIVVDNGSTDGSAEIAAGLGALVVHEPKRGFGSACHAGLLAATAPVVCFCDCDGSLDPAQLPRVAGPVIDGDADLVLGRRRPTAAYAWPPHARVANLVLARRLRHKGIAVRDLGPMRAARREALLDLRQRDRRSGYPLEMVLAADRAGWTICETDVDYAPRSGKSKVTGTVSGTVRAVRDMNRVWRELAS